MEKYTNTGIGFTADIKVNPNSLERDEALEKWIESLNKRLEKSQKYFTNSADVLNSRDELEKIKDYMKRANENIAFMIDTIEKYANSKGIPLRRYFREFKLDFPSARNVLLYNGENIEKEPKR